jgi:hypothetical protein
MRARIFQGKSEPCSNIVFSQIKGGGKRLHVVDYNLEEEKEKEFQNMHVRRSLKRL